MENVKDIDGNSYKTVKIGDQIWMAENLKVTQYRNGDPIPNLIDDTDWRKTKQGAYCNYDNDESNVETYGRLYNWFSVDDRRGLAPDGWHVPTENEIKHLEMYLGVSESEVNDYEFRGTNEGSKLAGKANLWNDGDLQNNAEFGTSGFNLHPGGCRDEDDNYRDMGFNGYFWSSTEFINRGEVFYNIAFYRTLYYKFSGIGQSIDFSEKLGSSVRCVKD
jgi:uncharacterized protein (TIGR02145 family)